MKLPRFARNWIPPSTSTADFENVCVGPVEYDLACFSWRSRVHGNPQGDAVCESYGSHDRELVERLYPVVGGFLAAMTIQIVRHRPSLKAQQLLEQRLAYVRGLVSQQFETID